MTTNTTKKAEGLKILEQAIEAIKAKISEYGGEFKVVMAPKLVTAIDEADLARRLERAEAENAEVDGDDDEDENEEGMRFDEGGENGNEDDEEEDEE